MTVHNLASYYDKGYAIGANSHDTVAPVSLGPLTDNEPRPGYTNNDYSGRKDLGHPDVTPWHEYYVTGVDPMLEMVQVRNVWDGGQSPMNVPFADFQKAFQAVQVNPAR